MRLRELRTACPFFFSQVGTFNKTGILFLAFVVKSHSACLVQKTCGNERFVSLAGS
jgi:hypothetical protein